MARKTTPTHVLLNQIELSSSASSVTFSNIPQGYGDLVVVINAATGSDTTIGGYINNDTGANYTIVRAYGFSGGTGSQAYSVSSIDFDTGSTNGSNTWIFNFIDYSATDKHKTFLINGNQNGATVAMWASRWANTSAINSLNFFVSSSTWNANSMFSLYGVYA